MDISKIGKPVTRQELGEMKKKEEEKNRWNIINRIIKDFYNEVIKHAKLKNESKYAFDIVSQTSFITDKFAEDNKEDILDSAKLLFPDSKINFRNYIRNNNDFHDITDLDEDSKKIFDKNKYILMLVIEW
jgi:hypothetical protein